MLNWTALEGEQLFQNAMQLSVAYPELGYIRGIAWCKPSFYQDGILLSVNDGEATFACGNGQIVKLAGKSIDVVNGNKLAGLNITPDTAIDYMVFFTDNIAKESKFHIVREGDSLTAADGSAIPAELPVRLDRASLSQHFMRASVIHAGVLFRAIIVCDDNGDVQMVDEQAVGVVSHTPPQP